MSKSLPYHWKDYLQDAKKVDKCHGSIIHYKGNRWEFISRDIRQITFIKTYDIKPIPKEILESSPVLRIIKKNNDGIWIELIHLLQSQGYENTIPLIENLEAELNKNSISIGDLKSLSNRNFTSLFKADFYLDIAEECNNYLKSTRKNFNKLKKSCIDATSKQDLLKDDIRNLFRKFCRRNVRRIAGLSQPKIWQLYRPRFYFFLSLMILAGATLSHVAGGRYILLIAVGWLDLTLAVALLVGSTGFWQNQNHENGETS